MEIKISIMLGQEPKNNNTNPELQKYYKYLKDNNADVPPTYSSFENTLKDPKSAQGYYNYLRQNNFDAPETFDSFQSTFGLKKKDSTSTSTASGKSSESVQSNGSLDSKNFELKPVFDERGRQVKIKNEKGELVPYMEKVPKGFASSTEEREIVREEQKQKASKPIIPSANLKQYNEATKITDEEKSVLEQEVNDEFDQKGIWNGIKAGTKKGFNFLADTITAIGTFGTETESPIQMEVDPFTKEKEEAKKQLISEKKSATPDAINQRAKEIKLNQRLYGLKVDKNNEYLSNLPEEEVKALNLEKVKQYKTLGDKEKYIATKSELLKNDFEKEVKDLTTARAIIKKNKSEGIEPNPDLVQFALDKQEIVKGKLVEAEELEKEYLNTRENIGTAEEEVDFLKRNYDTVDKVTTLAKLGLADIYAGISQKLPLMVSDLDQATFELLRPASSEGVLSEEERQELIDKAIDWESAKNLAKSKEKRDVDFDSLNMSNLGEFFFQELGTQLPIFAQMAMPGGVASIGMTSTFDKYGRMEQDSNNISFDANGKSLIGFQKENGEIVDSLGNTYDPNEVKITSLRTPDQSALNKFLTSVTFGTAESVLGAMPTKSIFGRALNSLQTSGERTLFRESAKQFIKRKASGTLDDTITEVVSEGATQIVQNIADITSGKKDVGVFDGVDHAAVSAGMLSFMISATPAVAGIALKPFSQNKENKQVNDNLQEIFNLQAELNNTEISDVSRAAIQNRINGLEKANGEILDGIANRTKGVSTEVYDAIKDVNKKQEILTIQATDIRNDNSLNPEVKKQLISDLESEFNELEKKRAKLVSGNATTLDALPNSESTRLKEQAKSELEKSSTDENPSFTEEQINAKAIEIYNQSNPNAVQQETTVTKTQQETQPQAEIKETEQEVLATPTAENITENEAAQTENTTTDGDIRPGIEPMAEVGGTTEQTTEDVATESVSQTIEPTTSQRETKRVKSTTIRNPKTGEFAEYDVDIENGQVVEIRKPRTGKVVPKFVEVKDKATGKVKRVQRNANWTAIADETLGQRTNNSLLVEEKRAFEEAIQDFTPTNEYEHALDFFARGGNVNSQSAQAETGLSNKEVKWATGFKPDSELPSVEAIAEKIVMDAEKTGVTGLDMQEVRNALIDIIKSQTRDSVKQEVAESQKSRQEAKEKSEEDAYLNSLTKDEYNEYQRLKAETLIERADQEFLESMTEDEIRDYYEQLYNEQQQSEQQYYETEQQQGEQRNEEQIGSTEISSVQEIQGEPKIESEQEQPEGEVVEEKPSSLDKKIEKGTSTATELELEVVIEDVNVFNKGIVLKTKEGNNVDVISFRKINGKIISIRGWVRESHIIGKESLYVEEFTKNEVSKLEKYVSLIDEGNMPKTTENKDIILENVKNIFDFLIKNGWAFIEDKTNNNTIKNFQGSVFEKNGNYISIKRDYLLQNEDGDVVMKEVPSGGVFVITEILINKDNQGQGTKIIKDIIKYAEYSNQIIYVEPSPIKGVKQNLNKNQLEKFYLKNGFTKKNEGVFVYSPKSERLTDQINDILDDFDKRLRDFGNETLGVNIPVVIARGAIKAMKLANNGVATLEDVVQAGIDYIKSTDWYANLSDVNKTAIDKNTFMSVLDSTIKANDAAKKTIESLRQKIQDNKTNSKQIVADIKNFLANNSIEGVLTPAQANALIIKANEILTAKDTLKAFDSFVQYYNKVKDKAENKLNEKAKAKLRYEKQKQRVLDLKSQGKSLSQTISTLEVEKGKPLSEKEKQIVELVFKTGDVANMTDNDVNQVVDGALEKSREAVRKSNNGWTKLKEKFKGLRAKFLDAQADAKRIIKANQLGTVLDRLIALKGASAKAEMVFNQAKEKIYSGLKTEQRKVLDEIIMLRRILAIDENRAKKGLTPVLHPDFITGEIAKRKLEIIKDRIGDQAYADLNNRADIYFDEFRNILNEMQKSGLISQQTRDELFDVDYQPRKFLHHLMNGSEEISENAKSWQKSTFSLSGDQINSLDEGSIEAMVLDSEWLLSTAMSMRYKSIFMNYLNSKLASEFNKKESEIKALKAIPENQRTKAEKKKIAEFEKMKEAFIDNPIIGVNKSGNPKYKFETTPAGYRIAYYYKNGVQNKFFIKEDVYEQWYNEKKFINNPKLIENISILSGSKLLKAMATGRNPFFLITNIPRDFLSILLISPEYSKIKPLAIGQLLKDFGKSFMAIKNKNEIFEKYFEYGGGMSFLSTEGMLTGKSFVTDLMESKSHNKIVASLLDANVKDWIKNKIDLVTLNEINQYSELVFRLSVFNRSIKNQLKELGTSDINSLNQEQQDDIYFKAVASARSIMDFNQGGYVTKDMEAVMPYLNAATQGSRVLFDAFAERPLETTSNILQATAIGVTSMMGLSLAFISIGKEDDDERSSMEIYLDNLSMVSPHDRRNSFIIFTGKKDADGNPTYIKIAKAQQVTPFTQVAEHHILNKFRRDYGIKEEGKLFEKSMSVINDNISPIQWMSFKEDPTLIGASLIARNPFGRAVMTYTTGYDFYRQEKLSWDIDKKGVPRYMEGYNSDRVDEFYKKIGMDLEMSPVRMKAMVESIVTSPSTNPYLGIMYGGLDAILTDDSVKERGKVMVENTLKNVSKRIVGTGKPYNKTLEEKEDLKKKIEVIQAENIIFNSKIDDIAKGFIDKKESKEVLKNKLIKELKLEPFKAERAIKRIEDKIKFKDVDQFYLDLKYEPDNEVKALMLYNHIGDIRTLPKEKIKEIGSQLEKIGFNLNEEIAHEYKKYINQFEQEPK